MQLIVRGIARTDVPINFELDSTMHCAVQFILYALISPLSQAGTMRSPRVTARRQNGPTSEYKKHHLYKAEAYILRDTLGAR